MQENYKILPEKIANMEQTTFAMAKLIQLSLVRLGLTPETPIARQIDLPNGLNFTELMYWLFTAIHNASKKAEGVLPANTAVSLITKWKLRR